MKDLIACLIPAIIITSLSPLMFFVKKNLFVGFRTEETLSDEVVWKKSNRFAGFIFLIVGGFLIFMSIVSYLLKFRLWFKFYPVFFLAAIGIGLIISIIYSKQVARERKGVSKTFTITNPLIILILVISLVTLITGAIMPFIPQNSFIGIRTSRTLNNPILWRKVNTVGGIGFVVIGLAFSFIFYRILKIVDKEKKTKEFSKSLMMFIVITFAWTIFSIFLPYIL